MEPHATRIGQLVIAWNGLHDRLAKLFELVVNSPYREMGISIWHSTDNDFTQRKMLRAAVGKCKKLQVSQRDDILWMLNQIDDPLRHDRNDVIHSPYMHIHGLAEAARMHIMPDFHSENPRAKSLFTKTLMSDLAEHIEETTKLAHALDAFADDIFRTILNPIERSWPQKPELPRAHRKKIPKGSSRQSTAK
jgi:hypothetical protein